GIPVLPLDPVSMAIPDPKIAFGPGGAWGTDLYLSNGPNLYRYDGSGQGVLIAPGIGMLNALQFGPDHALYVNSYLDNGIINIAQVVAKVVVRVDDGHGGFDTQSFTISVSNSAPGEIHGTVFDDLNGNGEQDDPASGLLDVNLDFSSLPSAQGWTYTPSARIP